MQPQAPTSTEVAVTTTQPIHPNQYLDYVMSNLIGTHMNSLTTSLTLKNIGILALYLCMGEIRKGISNGLPTLIQYSRENYKYIVPYIKSIIFPRIDFSKDSIDYTFDIQNVPTVKTHSVVITDSFVVSLMSYVYDNNCNSDIYYKAYKIISTNVIEIYEYIKDIVINYNGTKIVILSSIKVVHTINKSLLNSSTKIKECSLFTRNVEKDKLTKVSDLIDCKVIRGALQLYTKNFHFYDTVSDKNYEINTSFDINDVIKDPVNFCIWSDNFIVYKTDKHLFKALGVIMFNTCNQLNYLLKTYTNLNKEVTICELYFLNILFLELYMHLNIPINSENRISFCRLFLCDHTPIYTSHAEIFPRIFAKLDIKNGLGLPIVLSSNYYMTKILPTYSDKYVECKLTINGNSIGLDAIEYTHASSTNLQLECENEDALQAFLSEISASTVTVKESSIYKLYYKENITIDEVDNPEYAKYLEEKELIFSMKESKSQEYEIVQLSKDIPDKKIITKTVDKVICKDLVNNVTKSFETLYIKESQEILLKSTLDRFGCNKELLLTLGLPNKLCIMLEGLPGCGKTSTIYTIASYLKCNIYYLSFKNITTNGELGSIISAVDGIVIIEDIDAIGTLFHSRKGSEGSEGQETKISETDSFDMSNDKLTLSYILNLLNGPLTPDNLKVILTTNHIEILSKALCREFRMDLVLKYEECDYYQLNKMYVKFVGKPLDEGIARKLPLITPAKFIHVIKDYVGRVDMDDTEILRLLLPPI